MSESRTETYEYHFKYEPNWYWRIKEPTNEDNKTMRDFLDEDRTEVDSEGNVYNMPYTYTELARREIALLFAGTNIPKSGKKGKRVEEGGEPLIELGAPVGYIEYILMKLPHKMVMEIWYAIADYIPGWGPIVSSKNQD